MTHIGSKNEIISRIHTLDLHSLEYTLRKTFEKSLPQANYHHAGRTKEGLGKRREEKAPPKVTTC